MRKETGIQAWTFGRGKYRRKVEEECKEVGRMTEKDRKVRGEADREDERKGGRGSY